MTCCVFLGPSLPLDEARKLCAATYLPPIKQGDLLRALRDHEPDLVLIVDGYFEQVPAVWHKEILWALQQGVNVVGAASMGALRAAELQQFGMQGVGKVFQAYSSGRFSPFDEIPFEDDDEVAVVHGPAALDYVGSLAMVDLRATLAVAETEGVIGQACRDHLAYCGKEIFYKNRDYDAVIESARKDGRFAAELKNFALWVEQGKISQKRIDAVEALQWVAKAAPNPAVPNFRFEHTSVWDAVLVSLENETTAGEQKD